MKDKIIEIIESNQPFAPLPGEFNIDKAADEIVQLVCDEVTSMMHEYIKEQCAEHGVHMTGEMFIESWLDEGINEGFRFTREQLSISVERMRLAK